MPELLAPCTVLFVCTGNICRSPTAEGVFQAMVEMQRLSDAVIADSAGTHDYHVGQPPDRRAIAAAARRGYDISKLRARLFSRRDFESFDYVLAMDREHLIQLRHWAPGGQAAKPRLFLDFGRLDPGGEVPDPYYGGPQGFERVLDLVEDAAQGLLDDIRGKLGR
ncbi:MAG: low molecular weight protein-tyrosine-phosphatase [Burkholderiales bacterium]